MKMVKILIMIILILVVSLDSFCLYSNATEGIYKITELNTREEIINSHESDTENSNLELDYRNITKLIKGENINYEVPVESYEVTQEEDHMGYPRLKKLINTSQDGYKYILTFQNSKSTNDAGINIYYTRSKDLKNWDTPQILFKGVDKSTGQQGERYCYFSSCDSCVLNDGTIIAVASRYRGFYGDYGPTALNDQGLYMRMSKDNGQTWEEIKKIYTGRCWEPSILQLSTGEIHIYFTLTSDTIYVRGADSLSSGTAMISSIDGGNTWTPDVKGTSEDYSQENTNQRNPYAAYRIFQNIVRAKNTRRNCRF